MTEHSTKISGVDFNRGGANTHFMVMYGINTFYLQGGNKLIPMCALKGSTGVAMCVGEHEHAFACS